MLFDILKTLSVTQNTDNFLFITGSALKAARVKTIRHDPSCFVGARHSPVSLFVFMNMKISKISVRKLLLAVSGILALIGMGLYVWNYYDIGINSAYQARHDFTTAFQARQTGNCDEFVKWVSNEYDAEWKERCAAEKNADKAIAIVSFTIQNIQITADTAYLLVELKRSDTAQEKREPYSVNYELIRYRTGLSSWWLLNQPVK